MGVDGRGALPLHVLPCSLFPSDFIKINYSVEPEASPPNSVKLTVAVESPPSPSKDPASSAPSSRQKRRRPEAPAITPGPAPSKGSFLTIEGPTQFTSGAKSELVLGGELAGE